MKQVNQKIETIICTHIYSNNNRPSSVFLQLPATHKKGQKGRQIAKILDKTVEKIVYLDSIFLEIVAVPVLPSPPSPESNVFVYSKESLIPGRLWEATLNWGKGFSSRKGVILEIVLLCRKVNMMGKLSQVVLPRIVALN